VDPAEGTFPGVPGKVKITLSVREFGALWRHSSPGKGKPGEEKEGKEKKRIIYYRATCLGCYCEFPQFYLLSRNSSGTPRTLSHFLSVITIKWNKRLEMKGKTTHSLARSEKGGITFFPFQ